MPDIDLEPHEYRTAGERRKWTWPFAVAMTLLTATSATAGFFDGNRLLDQCADANRAAAYIEGVIDLDGWKVGQDVPKTICLSYNVTGKQVADIVCKHLAEHPETRQLDGAYLVVDTLSSVFPCR